MRLEEAVAAVAAVVLVGDTRQLMVGEAAEVDTGELAVETAFCFKRLAVTPVNVSSSETVLMGLATAAGTGTPLRTPPLGGTPAAVGVSGAAVEVVTADIPIGSSVAAALVMVVGDAR